MKKYSCFWDVLKPSVKACLLSRSQRIHKQGARAGRLCTISDYVLVGHITAMAYVFSVTLSSRLFSIPKIDAVITWAQVSINLDVR